MPTSRPVKVSDLTLDLKNFRTVPQSDEHAAVRAMISVSPEKFWALTASLLESGYLPTDNVIAIQTDAGTKAEVREGNRRVAALKLALGYLPRTNLDIPKSVQKNMDDLKADWKAANAEVPCTIYRAEDSATVDRIVTLAHGKAEAASRDKWTSVATARHARDKNDLPQPALDLLEKYLKHGANLSPDQRQRWGGDYPLAVLEEAIKRWAPRFGVASSPELAKKYPKVKHRSSLEAVIQAIGLEQLHFKEIRDTTKDFGADYGVPDSPAANAAAAATSDATPGASAGAPPATGKAAVKPAKSVALNDPAAVMRRLKQFAPRGDAREKVVLLLNEARLLKLDRQPLSFCFLLRSMFEISAKAYCQDHSGVPGLVMTKSDGHDKQLADVLREITNHMTEGKKKSHPMTKALHGAIAELANKDGFLSVTSMNQLVHNPSFSVHVSHVSTLFGNVFPLLEAMNQ